MENGCWLDSDPPGEWGGRGGGVPRAVRLEGEMPKTSRKRKNAAELELEVLAPFAGVGIGGGSVFSHFPAVNSKNFGALHQILANLAVLGWPKLSFSRPSRGGGIHSPWGHPGATKKHARFAS